MRQEIFALKLSQKRFALFCLAAAFCFCQTAAAQSGRRQPKSAGETVSKPPAAAGKTKSDADAEARALLPAEKISAIVILGQIGRSGFLFAGDNYFDIAVKECVRNLKERAKTPGLTIEKGGKSSFADAVKRAKTENGTHLLWLDLQVSADSGGGEIVDVNYIVLSPETGKRLTAGRVRFGQPNDIIGEGSIPSVPKVASQQHRPAPVEQIKLAARAIVERLVYRKLL